MGESRCLPGTAADSERMRGLEEAKEGGAGGGKEYERGCLSNSDWE